MRAILFLFASSFAVVGCAQMVSPTIQSNGSPAVGRLELKVLSTVAICHPDGKLELFASVNLKADSRGIKIRPSSDGSFQIESNDQHIGIEALPIGYTSWQGGTEVLDKEYILSDQLEACVKLSGGRYRLYRVDPPGIVAARSSIPLRIRYKFNDIMSDWCITEVPLVHSNK